VLALEPALALELTWALALVALRESVTLVLPFLLKSVVLLVGWVTDKAGKAVDANLFSIDEAAVDELKELSAEKGWKE
jgi:hypothetical protein